MKRILPLLSILTMLATAAQAQLQASGPNWNLARFGIALGGDIDMPHKLGHQYLLATARDVDFDNSSLPFTKGELTRMDCDNGTFRLAMSMSPARRPGIEWQFALLGITGRIDKVRYDIGEADSPDHQWLDVEATNKETAVEVAWLARDRTAKWLNVYGGFGTNLGYSHGGQVRVTGRMKDPTASDNATVYTDIDETYEQREGINQRLFFQGGVGFRFLRNMEFGLEVRKGLGYRASFGGPTHFTILKRSIGLSLRCVLF